MQDGIRVLLLFVLGLLTFARVEAQVRWTPVGTVNFRASVALHDGRVCVATSGGYLLWSADYGVSWTPQVLDTASGLNSIAFVGVDQSIGFAAADSNRIYRTTDHGANWYALPLPISTGIAALVAPSLDTIYACGNAGVLLQSVDGGLHWLQLQMPTMANLHRLNFLNARHGYIAADSGVLLETKNAGVTWDSISVPFARNQSISLFDVSPKGKLIAASYWEVGVSNDDGVTWTTNRIDKNVIAAFNLGKWIGEDTLVALQQVQLFVYYSTNGGATWDSTYLGRSGGYNDSWISAAGQLVVVGDAGMVWPIDLQKLVNGASPGDLLHSAPGGGILRDPVPGHSDHLHAVDVGSGGLNSVGKMFFTSDGGYTWVRHLQPKDFDGYIGLKFTSDTSGIIIPPEGPSLLTSYHPSYTTDNGGTWTKLNSQHLVAGPWSGCREGTDGSLFLFHDTAICYSTDNGLDWSPWSSCLVEPDLSAIPQLIIREGKFWGQDTAYLHIYDAAGTLPLHTLARTTDHGMTWSTRVLGSSSLSATQVTFLDPKIGIAVCGTEGVLRTIDGGDTWPETITGLPNRNWIGSVFNQSGTIGILMSYSDSLTYDDSVFVSFDSGITWHAEFVPSFGNPANHGISSAAFTDDTTAFINSNAGFRRTFHLPVANEGVRRSEVMSTPRININPCPLTSDFLHCEISGLNANGNSYSVTVEDVIGRKLADVTSDALKSWEGIDSHFNINLATLRNGTYFLHVRSGMASKSVAFLVIR